MSWSSRRHCGAPTRLPAAWPPPLPGRCPAAAWPLPACLPQRSHGGASGGGATSPCMLPRPHTPAQPLMRADFTLFDEYEHKHGGAPPFPFPVTAFWGTADRRISAAMLQVHSAGRRRAAGVGGALQGWAARGGRQADTGQGQQAFASDVLGAPRRPASQLPFCLLISSRAGPASPRARLSCGGWRATTFGRWRRAARRRGWRSSPPSWQTCRCEAGGGGASQARPPIAICGLLFAHTTT